MLHSTGRVLLAHMNPSHSVAEATKVPVDIASAEIDDEAREVIEECLRVARERLDMDIGWLAEFRGDRKVFRVVEGATVE